MRTSNNIPKILTFRELETLYKDLDVEHTELKKRYDDLTKIIRKQGKDSVRSEGDNFLSGYWD